MEERHLNIKKVSIAILIFVLAFLIIVGSALITYDFKNKKTSVSNENIVQNKAENIENKDEEKTIIDKTEKFKSLLPLHKEETVYSSFLPQVNENSVADIKAIYNSDEKQVFLTFDDGPTKAITPQILDILKEENVPATFFVLGSRVELNPELVKRAFEEGHYIANHGYSHSYSSMYSSAQAVIDEYNKTENCIQNALGIPDYHSYLFRFPGGSSGGIYDGVKQEAKQILTNSGIASTNWNCLNGDAEGGNKTEEQLLNRLNESQGTKTSLIILMHDASDKQTTVNSLKQIIQNYKQQGYVFKNFYDIF